MVHSDGSESNPCDPSEASDNPKNKEAIINGSATIPMERVGVRLANLRQAYNDMVQGKFGSSNPRTTLGLNVAQDELSGVHVERPMVVEPIPELTRLRIPKFPEEAAAGAAVQMVSNQDQMFKMVTHALDNQFKVPESLLKAHITPTLCNHLPTSV